MEKHKIDKLFAEKLQDFEQIPGVEAWESIEKSLKKKKNRKIWPLLGIAASAALVVLSSWYMLSSPTSSVPSDYSYADKDLLNVDVPVKIVYVPVIIQIPIQAYESGAKEDNNKVVVAGTIKPNSSTEQNYPQGQKLAQDMKLNTSTQPVIRKPLPTYVEEDEELVIASAKQEIATNTLSSDKSLTIIYKQGAPETKSKFTQAISYMEDVRNGDKKLNVFKKLRENIETKLKSNKEQNSK